MFLPDCVKWDPFLPPSLSFLFCRMRVWGGGTCLLALLWWWIELWMWKPFENYCSVQKLIIIRQQKRANASKKGRVKTPLTFCCSVGFFNPSSKCGEFLNFFLKATWATGFKLFERKKPGACGCRGGCGDCGGTRLRTENSKYPLTQKKSTASTSREVTAPGSFQLATSLVFGGQKCPGHLQFSHPLSCHRFVQSFLPHGISTGSTLSPLSGNGQQPVLGPPGGCIWGSIINCSMFPLPQACKTQK